jgi:carboxymethylenebutenolidase
MTASGPGQPDIAGVFEQHQYAEFVLHDAAKALETMIDEPSVRLMPTLAGGDGREAVYSFYSREFIPSLPPDLQVTLVSRTVGAERLVDEDVLAFTHTVEVPWLLPGVPPTGRRIEIPGIVIVDFEGGRVARERVYWDQASVLAQAGLLDADQLRVIGSQAAIVVRAQARTAPP